MIRIGRSCISVIALWALTVSGIALADDVYPNKPIRVVIGFSAGGGTDMVLRSLAGKMTELLGVQVLVENRPGANGNIAGELVAKSPADGYTLLYNTSSVVLSQYFYSKLAYDPGKDLMPVALTINSPLVIAVHPGVPANTIQEFVAYLKANPGKVNYSAAGAGNITHVAALHFLLAADAQATHVPYKGEAQALADLMGGQVQFYVGTSPAMVPQVKAKTIRGLAVTSAKRMNAVPDIPTLAETIAPGTELGSWSGVMAPAKTPAAVIAKLSVVINRALQDPDLKAKIEASSAEVRGSTPEQYATFLRAESERWGTVFKRAGLKPD